MHLLLELFQPERVLVEDHRAGLTGDAARSLTRRTRPPLQIRLKSEFLVHIAPILLLAEPLEFLLLLGCLFVQAFGDLLGRDTSCFLLIVALNQRIVIQIVDSHAPVDIGLEGALFMFELGFHEFLALLALDCVLVQEVDL